MCRPVKCRKCGGTTWSGCGMHVAEVVRAVPTDQRCACGAGTSAKTQSAAAPGDRGRRLGLFNRKG